GDSFRSAISANGRFVAFVSTSTDLVTNDTNGLQDVFVRNLASGVTERVSVAAGGTQGNDVSDFPSVSADGHYVAFLSLASNLVPNDTNGRRDVFVRDRVTGVTEMVSISSGGT